LKRRQLLKHLASHGCEPRREGANHSICKNPAIGETTPVPRHTEIANNLARKIRKDLGVPPL
jgi:predicted RNA binding protein YcfA (HicA-like mRNA interferase family)